MNHIDFDQASVLFTDVDDTLTTAGRLLPETYQAICNLAAAGVDIIPVTGGCAGWCDQIIRTWPVKAVIGEGGAFYVEHTAQRAIRWHYWQTPAQHQLDQIRILEAVRQLDLGFYPILARDQSFRLVDVAIDYHQDQRLSEAQVAAIQQALTALGFNVRRSSIHLNVWLGDFDKCTMALRVGQEVLGMTPEQLQHKAVFIGDAPNDESMFGHFPRSVGVANIRRHLPSMTHQPAALTDQPCGLGFAEMADAWLNQMPAAASA